MRFIVNEHNQFGREDREQVFFTNQIVVHPSYVSFTRVKDQLLKLEYLRTRTN